MKKTILLSLAACSICTLQIYAQDESVATKYFIAGHTTVTAVMDSGQNNFSDADFSAIFLYKLSEKLFVESEIEIETGKILNWRQGVKAEIHYKVCDCCGWELKDENGGVVFDADDGYVPSTLAPKEDGYGDYIIMDIDENGVIADWNFDIEDFKQDED